MASRALRESLRYAGWIFNPFRRHTVTDVYDLIATSAISDTGLYLNLGYWQEARTLDQACEALVRLVGETARLGPGDRVVDAGFGFADQDLFWMRTFEPAHITGLNITASQVTLARRRVAEHGLAERIELFEASATDMPLGSGSFDKVLAVECAFHFDTRARFFQQAYRVLCPGGRLVLADVIQTSPEAWPTRRFVQKLNWRIFSSRWSVPAANADTRATYAAKLRAAGFRNIEISSIREHVFTPLHRHLAANPQALKRFHPVARLPFHLALRFDPETVSIGYDYVIASADKPPLSPPSG